MNRKLIIKLFNILPPTVVSAGGKTADLKQRPIFTGKRYVVDIYERSKHAKSHGDWIKNVCVVVN